MRGIAKMRAGRALAALGACALALAAALGWGAVGAGVALADEAPAPYAGTTYDVTVYAGNQGAVAGADCHVIEDVPFGGSVSFDGLAVAVPDDGRYYAKGLRLAGLDNVAASADAAPTFYYANADASGVLRGSMAPVTEDVDLVVAYGIMADRVQYVVRYVDADGAELASAQTFFGDIGDVPATAPAYVEGYLPDASLLTKTLGADPAENVFTFTYARLAPGFTTEQAPDGTVSVTAPDGTTAPGVYTTTPAAPTAPAPGAGAQGAAPATPAPLVTDAGTEVIDENETPLVAPREESLDDVPVPLAALPSDAAGANAGEQGARPWPAAPFLAAAAVLAAVVAVILIRARRKAAEE